MNKEGIKDAVCSPSTSMVILDVYARNIPEELSKNEINGKGQNMPLFDYTRTFQVFPHSPGIYSLTYTRTLHA